MASASGLCLVVPAQALPKREKRRFVASNSAGKSKSTEEIDKLAKTTNFYAAGDSKWPFYPLVGGHIP